MSEVMSELVSGWLECIQCSWVLVSSQNGTVAYLVPMKYKQKYILWKVSRTGLPTNKLVVDGRKTDASVLTDRVVESSEMGANEG